MKKTVYQLPLFLICFGILCSLILIAFIGSKAITVISENKIVQPKQYIIIDAGHGGIDGGATSCTGILESSINLQIALKLEDLLHLLGKSTVMIRRTDASIHTQGETIAAIKVSDLKERLKIANTTENAVLVSIHQNYFSDQRYSGAQVFYGNSDESDILAKKTQALFVETLNIGSKRQSKKAKGIYLMENLKCPGILVECGFLSNPSEEAMLCSEEYQKKICCVIASALSTHSVSDNIT